MISQNVAVNSLRSALSAIAWLHKINDFPDPTVDLLMKKVLLGVSKYQKAKADLAPLNREILHAVCRLSYQVIPSDYEQRLIRAVLLLMYHACLRVGEAVKSATDEHSLRMANVRITKGDAPVACLTLHSFKHGKDSKSFAMSSATDQEFCPVAALRDYLAVRVEGADTVFNDVRGKTVTRQFVADNIKLLVSHAGLDPTRYNTHSLRIGRTSDLAREGVPEAVIKETGRWESDAYKRYIRFPVFTLPR